MQFSERQLARRLRRADEGQALVLTAVAIVVLMLVASLGVDVGFLRYQKQQMQKAADAAAIAGASALIYNGDYTDAARNDSAANGFTHNTKGITVTVNVPPASGPFTGNSNYVEAIVAQPQPVFFARVGGFTSVNVRGRAVASTLGNAGGCIYVLDPTDSETFLVDGNVSISSACGILVDSNSGTALYKNGMSGTVTASSIGVVGDYYGTGFTPTPTTGIAPFSDPLAGVPVPTYSSSCDHKNYKVNGNGTTNLTHGTYCGGITVSGNGTVNFAAGNYILLGGGITVTGSPKLVGSGVMFYNTGNSSYTYGSIKMAGTAGTSLTAPTNGPQKGILFFDDRSRVAGSSWSSFDGTNGEVYSGALYFSKTNLKYAGTPDVGQYLIMVAWEIEFKGDVTLVNYDLSGGSPLRTAAMAE